MSRRKIEMYCKIAKLFVILHPKSKLTLKKTTMANGYATEMTFVKTANNGNQLVFVADNGHRYKIIVVR